jgi:lysyl-tRNA synthetase class 2
LSDVTTAPEPDEDLPEQMRVRRQKRDTLLAEGVDPYPGSVSPTHTLGEVVRSHPDLPPDSRTGETVTVAGRVIFVRNTGRLCFARLREGDGTELQAMLSLAQVGEESLGRWKALVDIGDHVAVTGEVVTSRRGELSVAADSWQLTSKSLRPLPVAHKPMSEEMRVRRRYLDLITRQDARDMVRLRATVLRSLRATLHGRGFVEVETPMLQVVHGGAAARPFGTHLNAFDLPMTLRIAIELHLKRAIVGGVDKVYEIGRVFRNEGVDSTHSPEFTMLEAYEAYGDYHSMAELTRALVVDAAQAVGSTVISDGAGGEVDLSGPWHWLPFYEAVSQATGEQVTIDTPAADLRQLAERCEVTIPEVAGEVPDAGQTALRLFEKLAEHTLREPTFVYDYPASVRPLARPHREDPRLAEAWDLIVAGVELAPAYSELVDPVLQRERLVAQSLRAAAGDPEAMRLDEDFLQALEHGMPPTGGMGLGVDRLVMLLTGTGIRDTILFPLLRPE